MNEHDEALKRQHAEWRAPGTSDTTTASGELRGFPESTVRSSFAEWCKLNGVTDGSNLDIREDMSLQEKSEMYTAVFREGQKRLIAELRDPNDNEVKLVDKLNLHNLRAELNALREQGDLSVLGAREAEIARYFQQAISEYPYSGETCHMAEILGKKEMNCVGASILGGALLKEAGIKYLLGHIGNHVLLVVVSSDGRILWQDMQDGLEKPELENEELTAEKIEGTTPNDIASVADNPNEDGLKFSVRKKYWEGEPMTVLPPDFGLGQQGLITAGFVLGNKGKNNEAIEILGLAMLKSPNDPDVHLGLARAYKDEGGYEQAIAACQKAIELEPDSSYLKGVLEELRALAAGTNT